MSVEFYVRLRDACDAEIERLKPEELKEKPEIKAVAEDNFFLNYKDFTTNKLGAFQAAEEKENDKERFIRALNILNGSTISHRYHGAGYRFSYWIWQDRIFRQLLKK